MTVQGYGLNADVEPRAGSREPRRKAGTYDLNAEFGMRNAGWPVNREQAGKRAR